MSGSGRRCFKEIHVIMQTAIRFVFRAIALHFVRQQTLSRTISLLHKRMQTIRNSIRHLSWDVPPFKN